MPNVYGHRKSKSEVETVTKETFDNHAHGNITRMGKVAGVSKPMFLLTDSAGNIIAAQEIDADFTINGVLKATRLVGTLDGAPVMTYDAATQTLNITTNPVY